MTVRAAAAGSPTHETISRRSPYMVAYSTWELFLPDEIMRARVAHLAHSYRAVAVYRAQDAQRIGTVSCDIAHFKLTIRLHSCFESITGFSRILHTAVPNGKWTRLPVRTKARASSLGHESFRNLLRGRKLVRTIKRRCRLRCRE